MRVGFAGLGRMGVPMVRNIAQAGFELSLWNRTRETADTLAADLGCTVAKTPRDLAENADVVITMLADDAASLKVHTQDDGLFAANSGCTFIEMGTMSPGHFDTLAESAPKGVSIIDAPVSGSVPTAQDQQLLIMAGCQPDAIEKFMPLMDAIGKQTICLGSLGAGATMKLAVNTLIHGLNQTVSEAMTLAEAAGISSETAFDVIEASAAAAPVLKFRRPLYLDEASHDVTFTVSLARKDMKLAIALAEGLGVAMPQGRETLKQLGDAETSGYGSRDLAAMLSYMRNEKS